MSAKQLCMDYPLRPDFIAQIVIPRDLSTIEAMKLCAFIKTLCAPVQPQDSTEDKYSGGSQ